MSRFDTHVHLWRRGDGHPVRIRERVPQLDQDFGLNRLLPELAGASVDRIILVSAAQTELEPNWLLEVARMRPDLIAGVIGWLNPADPDFHEKLSVLVADPAWLGLRLPIVLENAADFASRPGIDLALEQLTEADAIVQVLVNPEQIASIAPLLERHPGLRTVIDHAANPDVSKPPSSEWSDGISRLGALPRAACKVSAFWLPGASPPSPERLAPFAAQIVSVFGKRRIVAASNWPVTSSLASPGEILEGCELLFALTAKSFATNAARIYRRSNSRK